MKSTRKRVMVYRRTARSEKTREASREALLSAAARLLREHGYAGTTMQDVVRAAGTSIGNAYFYFQNKDELLAETVRRMSDERWDRSESLAASAPAGPKRLALIMYANILSVLGENERFARAIIEVQAHVSYVREASLERWRPILSACCPHLEERELAMAATHIWGANRTHVERKTEGILPDSPQDIAEFSVRWNLRALGFAPEEIDASMRYARRRLAKTE